MLDIMRRKKRMKLVLWLVIFSLALGMLLFFVPGVDMGMVATDNSAATVDGQAISVQEYSEAYRNVLKRYTSEGNKADPETLAAMGLPKQVLNGLISQKVVEIAAKRMGIDVTSAELRKAIETNPNLQNQGRFIGLDTYKALLAANNLTVEEYEREVRYNELLKKLRAIITDSINVSDRELRDEFSRTSQKTVADYVILKNDDFKKRVKPTEADLRAYFESHKDAYRIKEARRAQYLVVPTAKIIQTVQVTEQEIQAEWRQRPHDETVDAAHILFRIPDPSKEAEVKAKAESVLKQAKSGTAFADLAKKYSEDKGSAPSGGVLGPFQRGQMVKEFEDAAFSLKVDEISDLVRSQYGYHIIKVLRHETPNLEANRPSIALNIQMKKAREIAKQKAEQAAVNAQKQKDLAIAGKDLGVEVEVKEAGPFKKDDNPYDFGISQNLRDEVFELKEIGAIGKAVETLTGYAVPKLTEVQMPKPGEFTASRPQVERDFIDSKSKELMQAEAKKISEEAGKQGGIDKIAKPMGLTVKTSQPFDVSGTADPEIGSNSQFNQVAFDLQPGAVSAPIPLLDNLAVLQVKSRSPFDEAAFEKQKSQLKQRLLQSNQDPYFQDYLSKVMEELEKSGKIKINPKTLERTPSASY